ncbi:MAG: hypothetical protein GF308_07175 [Candidatus Heimdallarchaeota archaeon]|nr:hypothetical protein [Candidatus Heimdallarchaeota archaeon]
MVSNAAFYGVLGGLILVTLLLIAFFFYVKSKMPSPLLGNIMSTLHSALFGYESALIELIGPRGYRTHVFPQIVGTMRDMQQHSPLISDLFESESIKEALDKWMNILEVGKIVTNGSVKENTDGTFTIDIPHCMLCDPIHEMIGDQKGICPMALILSAAGSIADNTKEPEIEYSEFHPTGTITKVKFD